MTLTINQNNQALANDLKSESKGKFLANELISKQYTNEKGEIKGGNSVGYHVSFSDFNILSHDMRMKLESENKSALYHWTAFETIASSVQNLTPTNIGKALNDLLANEMGKTPKNGGDKKLSVSQKNRYINGFYSGINRLKNVIEMKRKEIEESENLVPVGFTIKNNGESKMSYQRMRKVSTPKATKPQKTKEEIKAELYAEIKAEIMDDLAHANLLK